MRAITSGTVSVLLTLFAFLTAAYLLVYSGSIESGDSQALFTMTSSLYRYGDTLMDLNAFAQLPSLPLDRANPAYPLRQGDIEPLQSVLALPLYALADRLPVLGLVQTTWLFNVFVTALTSCLLFVVARSLGAGVGPSLVTAVLYGVCTAAFPYAKTFFREPLSALTLLIAAFCADRTRRSGYAWPALAALATAITLMLLTRAASAFALPAFAVLLLPNLNRLMPAERRRVLGGVGVLLVLVTIIFVVGAAFGDRYNILTRLDVFRYYALTALHSYLLSIGGSFWGTSPVLLLLIPGCVLLWRQGHWRWAIALPLLVLVYAGGYAYFVSVHWFGGLSWPPRFLVATLPLLTLSTLPVAQAALDATPPRRSKIAARIALLILVPFSAWVQLTAVSINWGDYVYGLPPEALGTLEWGGGLNLVQYLRWVVVPQLWGRVPFDFAWVRANLPLWPAGSLVLMCAAGVWLWVLARQRHVGVRVSLSLLVAALTLAGLALGALHAVDPLYRGGDPNLARLLQAIETETTTGDVVLLSNPAYVTYFMNEAKLHDAGRIISLPDQPGDRPSPEQAPQVVSADPDLLLHKEVIPLLDALASTRDRLWLVENFGPALPWSVRPVERFLAAHYYPYQSIDFSPQVRLIAFDTTSAPAPYGFYDAPYAADLVFDGRIRLRGYDLPRGRTYRAGDRVPVSLSWLADEALDRDIMVGLYLRQRDGSPVVQLDAAPAWGFAPSSGWLPAQRVWDHRALVLPPDLTPGEYELWVKVYSFDANFAPVDLAVTGSEVREGSIGVLGRITVE